MDLRILRRLLVVWPLCCLMIGHAGSIPLSDSAVAHFNGTTVDPKGLPHAIGMISAPPLLVNNISPVLNRPRYVDPTRTRGIDRNGHLMVQLAGNTLFLPAAEKWNFLPCSDGGTIRTP